MNRIILLLILTLIFTNCGTSNTYVNTPTPANIPEDDIVRISNDDLEYDITIIEPGFNTWLASIARPKGKV